MPAIAAMPRSAPVPPPLPSEGGTYELQDGAWVCVQQTAAPVAGGAETLIPPQDDAPADPKAPAAGEV